MTTPNFPATSLTQQPAAVVGSTRAEQVQSVYQAFLTDTSIPAGQRRTVATGWNTYAAAHPNLDVQTAMQAYADSLAASGLVKAVGAAATGTTTAQNQIDTGAAVGAANLKIPAVSGLTQFFQEVTGFFSFTEKLVEAIFDWRMWASLGWLVLGAVLLAMGMLGYFRKGAATLSGAFAKGFLG